jgi:uncharacterized membrane protein (DUF373 family)
VLLFAMYSLFEILAVELSATLYPIKTFASPLNLLIAFELKRELHLCIDDQRFQN